MGPTDGAEDADEVEAVMCPERLVLDGDEGVHQIFGEIGVGNVGPDLGCSRFGDVLDDVAVDVVQYGVFRQQAVDIAGIDLRRIADDGNYVDACGGADEKNENEEAQKQALEVNSVFFLSLFLVGTCHRFS